MSIRVVNHHGASTFASLSPKQPFENKVLYTAPIDNSTNSFTIIAKNRQNSIITDVDSRQCTGSISRDYKMTSHGSINTYQPQSSSSQTDLMQSIKNWVNMTNPISDTQLLSHIGIQGTHIPSWMIKNAKWVTSGDISQQDLENALRYLASNEIIK
jgi:hypothetical protein